MGFFLRNYPFSDVTETNGFFEIFKKLGKKYSIFLEKRKKSLSY